MARFRFAPEVGQRLPGGGGLRPEALQSWLLSRGLPAERLEIGVDGTSVTLEGRVPDAEAAERILLAIGNLHGVATVEDAMLPARREGLLGALAGLSDLPAGAANLEGAEAQLRRTDDDPGDQAYGPGGSLLYAVRPGETLEGIAQRHYGMTREAWRIREANPGLGAVGEQGVQPGLVLRLPRSAAGRGARRGSSGPEAASTR